MSLVGGSKQHITLASRQISLSCRSSLSYAKHTGKSRTATCRFVKHMLHHQLRNHLKQFEEISIPAGA